MKLKIEDLSAGDQLKLDDLTLEWVENSSLDSSLTFLYSDADLKNEELTFSLKYWSSYLHMDAWDNSDNTESGMYIFRP